ncbi:hypothetical protein [Priestia taiwanensis]|uniref:Spore cortex-lytic enzyme n=1 Tax=Priestia taiwanensis TaxID=1347902 RepID=A0A917EPU4_9BACI|nr:hypothetical protein [Priestia taiwanensis]MBM7362642.1 hypothetical protein [Priestia taiwanensis]GGE63897.1 hypothetical protein GCM10007140_12680 [Priestia taiwanensis]
MKKQPREKKNLKEDIRIEQNAIYSDPKVANNVHPLPQPKDYDEIEY